MVGVAVCELTASFRGIMLPFSCSSLTAVRTLAIEATSSYANKHTCEYSHSKIFLSHLQISENIKILENFTQSFIYTDYNIYETLKFHNSQQNKLSTK